MLSNNTDLSGGEVFQCLRPFFENNNNLSEIEVERCQFGAGCAGQLSSTLRACNKSLKYIRLVGNEVEDGGLVDIIEALIAHPQLEKLALPYMNVGRNDCMMALTNLLRNTTINLQKLHLNNNAIGDQGVDIMVRAVANSRLRVLNFPKTTTSQAEDVKVLRLCWIIQTHNWRS